MHKHTVDYKKYIVVFVVTAGLFFSGFYMNSYINGKKIQELQSIQDKLSVDMLSSETQFSLLSESSCDDIASSTLSGELSDLAKKLDYGERTIGATNPDIVALRRYFSLMEIKDYVLTKRFNERCNTKTPILLYFYSNEVCETCSRQWDNIAALREEHPEIRVYVFEYDSDLSAIKALVSIFKIKQPLPAMVINGKTYSGFMPLTDLEPLFDSKTTATAAKSTTTKTLNAQKTARTR